MTNNPCISPRMLSPRDASHLKAFEPRQRAHSAEMSTLGTLTYLRNDYFEWAHMYDVNLLLINQDDFPRNLFGFRSSFIIHPSIHPSSKSGQSELTFSWGLRVSSSLSRMLHNMPLCVGSFWGRRLCEVVQVNPFPGRW